MTGRTPNIYLLMNRMPDYQQQPEGLPSCDCPNPLAGTPEIPGKLQSRCRMMPPIPPTGHIVTLTLRVKPAFIDRMRVIAHELSVSSRTWDGCIAYITAESVDTEGLFLIASVWRDKEAYEVHRYSPYVRAFESQIAPQVWREPVSSKAWRKLG